MIDQSKAWIIMLSCILTTILFIVFLIKSPKKAGVWLNLYGTALLSIAFYSIL